MFEGLMDAIHDAGEALAKYFPFVAGDKNELSDDIETLDQSLKKMGL